MNHVSSIAFRRVTSLVLAGGLAISGTTPVVEAAAPGLGTIIPSGQPAPVLLPESNAEGPVIRVLFNGQELQFDEVQPVLKDGSTLVPFRKLFETLGFSVSWKDDARQAVGTKDGLNIQLTINSTTAAVNDKSVPLEVPAQMIEGHTMVPLRFVAENSGYQVSFEQANHTATIRIEQGVAGSAQPPKQPQAQEAAEPYVVKGYVRDAAGNPLSGVSVYADNTLLYDSSILGVTDDNGYYRLELPAIATTWRMTGEFSMEVGGKTYDFDLIADGDRPFAGNTGAIRNFTWKNDLGYIYVYPDHFSFEDGLPQFNLTDLELTLEPVGPMIGGSAGQKIVKRCGPMEVAGEGIDKIPLGRYKATARWLPSGSKPIPMLIKIEGEGKFAESVEFDFSKRRGILSHDYMMELQVQHP
ncbi:stalk domain-containing protein [Paenibacillus hamazuiensis]|uniref:stalk domain-containing protein n=1 Tax=Paenibacillus hamazuiensis TaxID=2936508 RepID=UPI00200D4EF1|nr:stalk domain-containing protein [Paenibacillus hamazuiensis]